MDKKTIITLILCAGILFSWPHIVKIFFPEDYQKLYNRKAVSSQQSSKNIENTEQFSATTQEQAIRSFSKPNQTIANKIENLDNQIINQADKKFILENEKLRLVFSNRGAVLKEAELLEYKDNEQQGNEFLIKHNVSALFAIEEPLNLKKVFFDAESIQNKLIFTYKVNDDLIIIKEFILNNDYDLEFNIIFQNTRDQAQPFIEGYKLNLTRGIGIFDKKDQRFCAIKVLINQEDKKAKNYKKNKNENIFNNAYWIAQHNRYFGLIVKPEIVLNNVYIENLGEMQPQLSVRKKSFTIEKNSSILDKYFVYLGPKDNSYLKQYPYDFSKIINYGMFDIVGKGIFWLLTFFFGLIKNYGIAIILLAIVIKLITHPLTQKSFKSMQEMQKINPLLKELKEKHKNDPQKMQRETMLLYKKHKVNPLGGCMPMVIQMPIFFALFSVLNNSIELRQAPFMLWITDLSTKDPYFVLPIVMGITMFIQQKMSPTAMDPKQAKMMLFMPIVLTFVFVNFPAGLVLYWMTNNVLTIAHQGLIKK